MSFDGLTDMKKERSIRQGSKEHHLMLLLSCICDASEPTLSEYEVCFLINSDKVLLASCFFNLTRQDH